MNKSSQKKLVTFSLSELLIGFIEAQLLLHNFDDFARACFLRYKTDTPTHMHRHNL